jgi:hypothetical protein
MYTILYFIDHNHYIYIFQSHTYTYKQTKVSDKNKLNEIVPPEKGNNKKLREINLRS